MGGEDAGSGSGGAGAAAGRRQLRSQPAPPAPGCRVTPPQSGSRDEADIRLARHLLRDQARPAPRPCPIYCLWFSSVFRFCLLTVLVFLVMNSQLPR